MTNNQAARALQNPRIVELFTATLLTLANVPGPVTEQAVRTAPGMDPALWPAVRGLLLLESGGNGPAVLIMCGKVLITLAGRELATQMTAALASS